MDHRSGPVEDNPDAASALAAELGAAAPNTLRRRLGHNKPTTTTPRQPAYSVGESREDRYYGVDPIPVGVREKGH